MRTLLVGCLLAALPVLAAELPPGDVLLKLEAEQYGAAAGVAVVSVPGAAGGSALSLSPEGMIVGAVKLAPGRYTLLVRAFAPAGDQDGFFIDIARARTRRTAPIGRWGVLALPLEAPGEEPLAVAVIGQEPGVVVDQLAVVRGAFKDDEVDLAKLAPTMKAGQQQGLENLSRLQLPARLRELPAGPFVPGAQTLLHEPFESVPGGATGRTSLTAGKWGQALYLGVPDGRYDVAGERVAWGATGTIEWWVRPRPGQRLWEDQGWHYFLYGAPAAPDGLRLDLSRHPAWGLQLAVTAGEVTEKLQLSTNRADPQQWHHLLVSWDLRGDRQYLWLLLDGAGLASYFPRCLPAPAFRSLQFGNTPAGSGRPWLFMDGALDELLVSTSPVSDRLEALR